MALSILNMAGCALSTEIVNLKPTLNLDKVPKASTKVAIKINQTIDDRGLPNNLIIHKLNGYGNDAAGGYVGNISLANYMQNKIVQAFTQLNYHVVNKKQQVTLTSRIIALDCKFTAGLISGSYGCNLQIEFSLDTAKRQVWSDVISGYSSLQNGDDRQLNILLNRSSNDLINKLFADEEFQMALRNTNK